MNKYKIHYQVDHMLGIPGETDADQKLALEFYNEYRPDIVSVFWLKYYPKLPIIDFALEKGILEPEEIADIEEGRNEASYLFGGNAPEFKKWLGYNFLFGWLNFLPKRFVDGLVKHPTRIDWFAWESFFFAASLPRLLSTMFRRPDFRGRDHIRRMLGQMLYIGRLVGRDWWRGAAPSAQASPRTPQPEPPAWPPPAGGDDSPRTDRIVVGRRSGGKITASR
jgi:hypothetical protein